MKASEALDRLEVGNQRYLDGREAIPVHGGASPEKQAPYVTVLTCSDSRVPVEHLFNEGIGALFVVRLAGNRAQGPGALGSLEYGALHLKTPLVLVLGHSRCGAVRAALDGIRPGSGEPGLAALLEGLGPSLDGKTDWEQAVEATLFAAMEEILKESPGIAAAVKSGETQLHGAMYSLESGKVSWLGPHPDQAQILSGRS